MGNSPSVHSPRRSSPAAPPRQSRPLKHKKRSIVDHPQLLLAPTLPSSPIPIPAPHRTPPRLPPPDSTDHVPDLLQPGPHSAHLLRPIHYNSTRSFGAVPSAPHHAHAPAAPPPTSPSPVPDEIVRSSIPLRIHARAHDSRPDHSRGDDDPEHDDNDDDDDDADADSGRTRLIATTIVWSGGGNEVLLAGTFDELEWRARERMRFDPATQTHTLTLPLPPGTYRLKFIVDDTWRCSDDMPTATDDGTGNLVNYIDVEDPSESALVLEGLPDERQGREARVMKANRRRVYPPRGGAGGGRSPGAGPGHTPHTTSTRSPTLPRYHPPLLPPSESAFWAVSESDEALELAGGGDGAAGGGAWERGRDGALEKWTSAVPEPWRRRGWRRWAASAV
ncbi:carbohydrate-binding module family 48 protein [Ramaria rubella]|nr:carbohydrate-binding module family 48 protein [Ramaria rubella]